MKKNPKPKPAEPMKRSGEAAPSHDVVAEQAREREESRKADSAQASNRDRMVEIGRGNKQAGRQKS